MPLQINPQVLFHAFIHCGLNCIVCWQGCEREVAEANDDKQKSESIMRLSWALVHSRQAEDVQRGIAMLEGELKIKSCTQSSCVILCFGLIISVNFISPLI